MGGFDDFLGEKFGSDPIIGGFIESPAEKARKGQVKDARHTAEQYQKYRPEVQEAFMRQKAATAGGLGPLNALVQQQTGQSIDLGAMMNQRMVSPEMMAIGAPRAKDKKKKSSSTDGLLGGAGVGLLLGDPVMGAAIGWAGSELDWW